MTTTSARGSVGQSKREPVQQHAVEPIAKPHHAVSLSFSQHQFANGHTPDFAMQRENSIMSGDFRQNANVSVADLQNAILDSTDEARPSNYEHSMHGPSNPESGRRPMQVAGESSHDRSHRSNSIIPEQR